MIRKNKTTKVSVILFVALSFMSSLVNAKPYSLEHFSLRDVVSNVMISPDGKRLALMKNTSQKGNPVIEIYDAADLSKKPFRTSGGQMEIMFFKWVSDSIIVMMLRQRVRDKVKGWNDGVF